jgi:hypothetical protein
MRSSLLQVGCAVAELGFATAHAELSACSGLEDESELAECGDAVIEADLLGDR